MLRADGQHGGQQQRGSSSQLRDRASEVAVRVADVEEGGATADVVLQEVGFAGGGEAGVLGVGLVSAMAMRFEGGAGRFVG